MFAIRRLLLAGLASSTIVIAGAIGAHAGPLELNPSAPNGAFPTLDQTLTTNPFFTTNSNTAFSGDLHILGTPGSSNTVSATETGSILITTFNVLSGGPNTNVTTTYNLYATYTISGTGSFNGGSTFTLSGPVSATVTLVGSPTNNTTSHLDFTTPTPGTFGVIAGNQDFTLGTATLLAALSAPTASGTCTTSAPCSTTAASTSFNGIFGFTPVSTDVTGPGGFFVNLNGTPFQLSIGAIQGGAPFGTLETVGGGVTDFVVGIAPGHCDGTDFSGSCPGGGGQLTYDVAAVPEPASLSLLGAGLIGLGVLYRRRRRNA